jgi:hypothetical protein
MKYIHLTTSTTPSSDYLGGHVWYNPNLNATYYTFGERVADLSILLKYARKIKAFIDDYKTEHSSISASTDLILAQYGRIGRYDDVTWDKAGGTIDSDLRSALDSKYSFFKRVQEVELPNGDTIDAPHFWAVINTIMTGNGDLGGWAGDLVEYAALLKTSPDEPFPTIQGAFDRGDWNSDADAYNIMKTYSNDVISDIESYFTKDLIEKQRIDMFITNDDIKTRFNNSSNKGYLMILMLKYGVSDITDAAEKMQEYLDENK